MSISSKSIAIIGLWLLALIWGSNFMLMKIAVWHISPTQVVLVRVAFGFIPVFAYALFKKEIKFAHVKHLHHFVVMSLFATVLNLYGFVKGTELLQSGIAGAMSGAAPIFAFIVAVIFLPQETFSIKKLFGITVGFLGVLLIANPFSNELKSFAIEGVLFMVMASVCLGASFVYSSRFISPLKLSASALTTYQLGIALIILLVVIDFDGLSNINKNTLVFSSVTLGLGFLGTGIACIIYYFIIDQLGAVKAASVSYITPVVALLIGSFIALEPIGKKEYFAAALITLGVYLLNNRTKRKAMNLREVTSTL
ncbi:DMT family transporter [Litorilituus lipolyticus]|uniref:DMT family transporter n=1 Tax=Litorilituus lipolyticus TaxID=2491017 RepID=A0A502KR86_9GAMM|nr:DMT family transporter [Litorilituus lipolyticus]TPH12103.1 DMT family transporter [Litorilituus lipolyticus]